MIITTWLIIFMIRFWHIDIRHEVPRLNRETIRSSAPRLPVEFRAKTRGN